LCFFAEVNGNLCSGILKETQRDAVGDGDLLGCTAKTMIQGNESLRNDAVGADQGLEFRKPALGWFWRLGPLAFDECEMTRRRNQEVDLEAATLKRNGTFGDPNLNSGELYTS